ncbi:MAG: TonB-dependent receptor, partial [Parvularcula sp.]|nr:TonB-dependent receptor [Parvularcula sp.]
MSVRTAILAAALPLAAFASASAQQNEEEVADEIVVQGRAQKLYRIGESDTGKLPSDPLETPIVITTINEQLIEDQGARDAQDIYRNISGVSLFSYAGVTARGFRQEEIFFDGLRGDPYVGFNVPQLFNVSRVDFLKGPAAVLYGPGAPGGLFNYVTKKPEEDFYAEGRLIYGSEGRRGASFEINGALPVEGSAGRIGIFHEDRNLPRTGADSVVTIYDAGVSQELGFAKLTLQATRYEQDQKGNRLRGVPVDEDGEFLTDRRWNHNEPDDFLDLWSNNLQARLEGEVGEEFTWNAGLRWTDSEQAQQYHEPLGLFPLQPLTAGAPGTPGATFLTPGGQETLDPAAAETVMVREFRDQLREQERLSFGVNGIWSREFENFSNRLLFGIEHYEDELFLVFDRVRGVNRFAPGLPQPLSLRDPVYGQSDPANYNPAAFTNFPDRFFDQTRQGAYLLEELTLGKLILTGGVRFDRFEDSLDYENDVNPREEFDDEALTFRAGAVYRITDEISAFAQWAEGFEPQGTGSQDARFGGPFDPQLSESYEGGIKTALFGGRLNSTLA